MRQFRPRRLSNKSNDSITKNHTETEHGQTVDPDIDQRAYQLAYSEGKYYYGDIETIDGTLPRCFQEDKDCQ